MRCGLVNCQWFITDQRAGDGGLVLVPGSHKANMFASDSILGYETDTEVVHQPDCRAGDLVIFAECTTHGILPWRSANERRTVCYRTTSGSTRLLLLPAGSDL